MIAEKQRGPQQQRLWAIPSDTVVCSLGCRVNASEPLTFWVMHLFGFSFRFSARFFQLCHLRNAAAACAALTRFYPAAA
jgi:hypothetical protein